MFRVGTAVTLNTGITGSVVGHGTLDREACCGNVLSDVTPVYLVELDEGFFDPSNRCWVAVLVVHGDSLRSGQ